MSNPEAVRINYKKGFENLLFNGQFFKKITFKYFRKIAVKQHVLHIFDLVAIFSRYEYDRLFYVFRVVRRTHTHA